jgi:MFS family permease
MANLRAWQSAYSFHWWQPLEHFDDDTSTSWVFTAMLVGIALLVLSAVRAIPQNWRRLIVLLGMVGAIGSGYVLINLSRLVIFLASFFLPLEHVTRSAIPLLPWLGLTIVFVSIEIAGGLVGNLVDESVREWFARLRAWSFLFGIAWFAFTGSSLLGPGLVSWLFHVARVGKPLWVGWLGTTLVSVLAGKSSLVSGNPKDGKSKVSLLLNGLVLIGPPVFIIGLVLTLSWVVEKALNTIQSQIGHLALPHSDFVFLLVLLAFVAVLFGWRIDINEFSLHAFYRDRIARCYAAASNPDRRANRFTGFAASDKRLRLIDLLPKNCNDARANSLWATTCSIDGTSLGEPQTPLYEGPFPIFNTTINLSFGQDLAYQERKGASFVFTPLYCGYDVGWTETDTDRVQFNGFCPTRSFAYNDGGPRMATAVATSGAAMSPNWGFHSSPTMAFLLTIFNVRLGLWIRNPRHKRFRLRGRHSNPSSPWFGLFYLAAELFGMVNDEAAFVYLTDGGHFENMGLYELVRRHCSVIIVCDSEQDGGLTYQGMGMAIRKCRIDHGAEITLDLSQLEPTGDPPTSPQYCVAGTIRYANGAAGQILYIKSAYTRDLPADLVNFHKENPDFPNTSTADQWFSESQFESYRRLGQHYARSERVLAWMDRHLPIRR